MVNCILEPFNGKFRCNKCGIILPRNDFKVNCKAVYSPPVIQQVSEPSFIQKTMNFGYALANHIAEGSPMATQDVVDQRLRICEECPLFKRNESAKAGGICTHSSCGCNIKDEVTFLNKLAWADQKCPIDKWGPVETQNGEKTV